MTEMVMKVEKKTGSGLATQLQTAELPSIQSDKLERVTFNTRAMIAQSVQHWNTG
jgi:hypothetical protein